VVVAAVMVVVVVVVVMFLPGVSAILAGCLAVHCTNIDFLVGLLVDLPTTVDLLDLLVTIGFLITVDFHKGR
jgi:hypothetical protein